MRPRPSDLSVPRCSFWTRIVDRPASPSAPSRDLYRLGRRLGGGSGRLGLDHGGTGVGGGDGQDVAQALAAQLRDFFRTAQLALAVSAARQRLIGFDVPSDFASTSLIPASSSTARTPAPAMTPVPGEAGFQHHAAGAEHAEHLVGDRRVVLRHLEHVLLGILDRLLDGDRDLAGLAVADADLVDLVADDDERRERKLLAALDDLGNAIDLDDALDELPPSLPCGTRGTRS